MARQMCQSCGMPIGKDELKGSEADGSKSQKYCVHCYKEGKFTWPGATAAQMQTFCMGILTKKHWPTFMARLATNGIPKLECWKKA